MKVKRKAFITSIIVMLSTILIGFIGWGLTTHSFERTYKRTIVSKNCIEVNSFTFSDYCEYGFVNDYIVMNIAYLDINITFDLDGMRSFIDSKSFDFESKLEYQSFKSNYFDIINTSYQEIIILDNLDYEINDEIVNNDIKSSFTIKDDLSNLNVLNITIRYIFDVTNYIKDSNFKDKVYDLLINKGIPLDFKITIE